MQQQVGATNVVVPRVLVFFDYACQFCYLDWPRFKRLRAEQGVELFLVPYELRPQMPLEGIPVDEIGEHSERVKEHMQRMARDGGVKLTFPSLVPHTHLALALGEYARDQGPEAHEAIHEAIFEAYNARGENIGDRDVLLEIASSHALDIDDVAQSLDEGEFDDRIHRFFHLALAMGISGTPAALICNELFIGTRPYQVLRDSVERCTITKETLERDSAAHKGDAAAGGDSDTHDSPEGSDDEPVLTSTLEGSPPSIDR